MANTYTQLNVHAVFSVLGRENMLLDKFRPELFGLSSLFTHKFIIAF